MDIVYSKKDVRISIGIEKSKSLIYQAMLLINPEAIVLTIISTIILMQDQEKELTYRDVSALALTAAIFKVDPNIWKQLEQEEYSVIFIIPKIVLASQSYFWKYTIGRKRNEFYCNCLTYIAIDEAYLI